MCAITAQAVDMGDAVTDEVVNDFILIEATTGRAENSATESLNLLHVLHSQLLPVVLVEATIAVLNAIDVTHTVVEVQTHEDLANNDVQTRA